MKQEVAVTLKISNRQYKLRVEAEHESYIRQTAHSIQDQITQFRKTFPGRDEQDYLAMVLIDFLSRKPMEATVEPQHDHLLGELKQLIQLIDE